MPNTLIPMKLSPDEDRFLRRWIFDEVHYRDGQGSAKRLQIQHLAIPADLATLIAAAIPDPIDQEEAGLTPAEQPEWPWSEDALAERVSEARDVLMRRSRERTAIVSI